MIWMRRTRTVLLVGLVLSGTVGPTGMAGARGESGSGHATGGEAGDAERPTVRADFNNDGAEDLAIGAQFESVGSVPDAGTVFVLLGRSGGLAGTGSQLFNQDSHGIASVAEPGDVFGSALAAGDFDGDGFTDLAVGSRGESVGDVESAGVVHVLYGSSGGLEAVGSQMLTQDSPGIGSTAEEFDGFGGTLTAADFNGDGADDLAAGADFERVGTVDGAGAVNVLYGATTTGLSGTDSLLLTQSGAVNGQPGSFDQFGSALAAADFDNDGFDDLAVGVPRESGNNVEEAGTVHVLHGSGANLTPLMIAGDETFTQNTSGVGSDNEPFDHFGAALATGNFNGDDFVDLAVGAPGETVGNVDGAGTIFTLVGTDTGVRGSGSQLFNQESPGIASTAEYFDAFGSALAAGDFNGDGSDDLAIGVPNESVGTIEAAGVANVLYSSDSGGLSSSGSQLIAQGASGVGSTAETGDQFATALAAGDFNADGSEDLAIGAPFESVGPINAAGAINVLSGSTLAGLAGPGSKLFTQDSPGIGSTAETFDTFGSSLAVTTPTPTPSPG
jgi:hypothetical protein